MRSSGQLRGWIGAAVLGMACAGSTSAQLVISGNENKIELTSIGGPKGVEGAPPDSITLLDFAVFPPKVTHLQGVSNSVVGPPSNIAISPNGRIALIADSLKLDRASATGWTPINRVHVLDLTSTPPKVVGVVETELQPSGLSFTPDGRLAIVANRASGSVSVLSVEGMTLRNVGNVKVCEPAESLSDIAISPDGKMALASALKGGYLAVLKIDGQKVAPTGRKVSVYGQPYRVVITPDGAFGLTAGTGWGNGVDEDALSVIDLKSAGGPKTVQYVPLGAVPESIEVSPDGKLVAAVCMEGSNFAPENPLLTKAGSLVICERKADGFERVQKVAVGRIPEGVAFTSDGKYIVVQCHPDRELRIFEVRGNRVEETGTRISTPGMPSSLRASPRR